MYIVQVHSKIICYDFFSILGDFDFILRPFLNSVTQNQKLGMSDPKLVSQNVFDAITYRYVHFFQKLFIFDRDTLYKKDNGIINRIRFLVG